MNKRYYSSCEKLHLHYKNFNFDLDDLFNMFLKCWTIETCAPRLRENWSIDNPTEGQCSITSFIIQDYFGGEVYGVARPGGTFHCFNKINDIVFDLTNEQFHGEKLDYSLINPQSKDVHFKNIDKYERYLLLKKRFETLIKK